MLLALLACAHGPQPWSRARAELPAPGCEARIELEADWALCAGFRSDDGTSVRLGWTEAEQCQLSCDHRKQRAFWLFLVKAPTRGRLSCRNDLGRARVWLGDEPSTTGIRVIGLHDTSLPPPSGVSGRFDAGEGNACP